MRDEGIMKVLDRLEDLIHDILRLCLAYQASSSGVLRDVCEEVSACTELEEDVSGGSVSRYSLCR